MHHVLTLLRFVTCVLALLCPKADAATVSSHWRSDFGNWTGSTNWIHSPTDPAAAFPDNNAVTYDVTITNGHVLLQQSVTIDKLTFAGGLLNNEGVLTLGDWFNWSGGTLSGTGTLVASYGLTATGGTNESTLRLRGMAHDFSFMHQLGTVFVETNYAVFDGCSISGSFSVETNARLWFTSNYFANGSAVRGNGRLDLGYFEGVLSNSCRVDIAGPNRGLDGSGRLVLADHAAMTVQYGFIRGSGSVEIGPQASIIFERPSTWTDRSLTNYGTCVFSNVVIKPDSPTNSAVLHNYGHVDIASSFLGPGNLIRLPTIINHGLLCFTNDWGTELRGNITNYGSVEMFFNGLFVSNFVNFGSAPLMARLSAHRVENRAGILAPWFVTGTLTNNATCDVTQNGFSLNGVFQQSSNGILRVTVDERVVTNQPAIQITAEAYFDGTLIIQLTNGFQPSLGQRLRLITNNSAQGFFRRIRGLDLGNGLRLAPEVTAGTFDLVVVAATNTSPASLRIWSTSDGVTLHAPASLQGYFLQSATNLVDPGWQTIGFVRSNTAISINTTVPQLFIRAQDPACCE